MTLRSTTSTRRQRFNFWTAGKIPSSANGIANLYASGLFIVRVKLLVGRDDAACIGVVEPALSALNDDGLGHRRWRRPRRCAACGCRGIFVGFRFFSQCCALFSGLFEPCCSKRAEIRVLTRAMSLRSVRRRAGFSGWAFALLEAKPGTSRAGDRGFWRTIPPASCLSGQQISYTQAC